MELDVRPIVLQCRVFKEGEGYNNRDKYEGTFNVTINGNTAYVSMLQGTWSREIGQLLHSALLAYDVDMMDYEMHGRRRRKPVMAFG